MATIGFNQAVRVHSTCVSWHGSTFGIANRKSGRVIGQRREILGGKNALACRYLGDGNTPHEDITTTLSMEYPFLQTTRIQTHYVYARYSDALVHTYDVGERVLGPLFVRRSDERSNPHTCTRVTAS